ncbi:Metallo-dependent hydrolase [Rhodofomes roseus]|uniref:Metallo-dependent hydrolase n=1 Tax=Rhodofomes roseus TaxID=34475 RepID=A0ABQ8KG47_9APHY|nr:Metallo-dependent hydrolase [Rhodofomes roseus]KAH9836646.1 Metallo-dependent hydrolase [Rhodofomes roseus]
MSSHGIAGFAAAALASLTPKQIEFLRSLPKAELHAHLNGSIPLSVLQDLSGDYLRDQQSHDDANAEAVRAGIDRLSQGVVFTEIHDFFGLFPAIYTLTSTPQSLAKAARAVLHQFLSPSDDGSPEAAYLELRSTPRETPAMSRLQYLEVILDEVENFGEEQAALIISMDRRMTPEVASECVDCAIKLRDAGRRVVGVDLCGDVKAGNVANFEAQFRKAKTAGLGVTTHIAEIPETPAEEIQQLLSYEPDRLGHATFLDETSKELVRNSNSCIEICLSSNLLCKTVDNLDVHHIRYYLRHNHPIAICTDDILPFRNSLLGEYALLMAAPPLGLGLSEEEIRRVAQMGLECRFPVKR